MKELDRVIIEPKTEHKASIIWMHGLGADGHDFESIVPELRLPEEMGVRFVFPHATMRPVTLNAGFTMRAWFDILSLEKDHDEDEAGIREAQKQIEQLILLEESSVPSQRIVLAGFSQGGAIALQTGLRYGKPLAGIFALSTYLPLARSLKDERSEANLKTAIFMAHGAHDPVVQSKWGKSSAEALRDSGFEVDWHDYPMEHSLCLEEIRDLSRWLIDRALVESSDS